MLNDIDRDRHYGGIFQVAGQSIPGEIVYNKENGIILLSLTKEICKSDNAWLSGDNIQSIVGKLHVGTNVTLYNNICIKNHINGFRFQRINYRVGYVIWGIASQDDRKFNRMTCSVENGMQWGQMFMVDGSDFETVTINSQPPKTFQWYGAKVTFSAYMKNELWSLPRREESHVIERLQFEIECDSKQDVSFFLSIRNNILALISFAIKDNVNVIKQDLSDFDDAYVVGSAQRYYEYELLTSEPHHSLLRTSTHDFNFTLSALPDGIDLSEKLDKLAPIFNLYLSLFKYKDMPLEMVFLNIIQALETLHARFYGKESDKLRDRISSLLGDTVFSSLCAKFPNFVQTVVDTRNYYTHYNSKKQKKALRGDDLLLAIHSIRLMLEYYVCKELGIDKSTSIVREIGNL